jgi:DNA-binding transcriptional regulator YiaG
MTPSRQSSSQALTPAQCRAIRAWFSWSQDALAERASVSVNSVRNFEAGKQTVHPNTVAAIQRAVEAAGVALLFDREGNATGFEARSSTG